MVYQFAIAGDQIMERNFADNGGFASSEDAPSFGLSVTDRDGRERAVSSSADLKDTDRIMVQGIPVSVAQAKALGLTADIEKAVETGAKEATEDQARLAKLQEKAPTDLEAAREQELAKAVEAGLSSHEEVAAGERLAGTMALHVPDLPEAKAVEFVEALIKGEADEADPTWQELADNGLPRDAFKGQVDRTVQTAQEAALKELGADRMYWMRQWAEQSPTVKNMIAKHGIARAQGKSKETWGHVYAKVHAHMSR